MSRIIHNKNLALALYTFGFIPQEIIFINEEEIDFRFISCEGIDEAIREYHANTLILDPFKYELCKRDIEQYIEAEKSLRTYKLINFNK